MLRITGRTLLIMMLLGLPAGYRLEAQVPGMISYQARIIDEQAGPVNDTRAITFAVYAQAEGGTAVWSEQQNVAIVDGLADVMLGKTVPLTGEIFQSGERYLGVKIGSDPELKPRKRLLAVPYALRAESATIRITPSGGISSTDVNSAIQELDAEKLPLKGGTLSGRLNIYNEESNDVGIDALSADSAAILAMNSGSTDPAMVAYNYGEGDGMYSFAEMGNALWAYNNSEGYVTIYASTDGNTNVFKGWSESEYPNIFVENEGSGSGIYGYSNSGNGVWGEAEGGYAAVGGSNSGEGSGVYGHSMTRNGVWAVAEGEYAAVAAESQSSGTGVYAYSAEGFGGVFATDAADVCA
ncbi:MAG: hypothetical protein JXQ83_08610, partial [Candidatus Glassbacteria bacterium]|nr:hypothetical protein [Candidatus Glassbacteria bacterium]